MSDSKSVGISARFVRPIWVFAVRYRDDKPPLRVLINGQTGTIAGKVPLSVWKILFTIVGALAVIAAIIIAMRSR